MHCRRQRAAALPRFLAPLALAVLSACAGNGPPPQGAGSAFDQLQTNIFNVYCATGGCHNAQSQQSALNLSAGASYNQLVNVLPQNPVALSAGLLRVQPFNPSNSFLLTKVTNPGPGEGSRMPIGMDPLSPSDIEAIQSWIVSGAPPGGTTVPTATATPVPPSATVTLPPTAAPTATVTVTPADTGTATATVTGSPPPTSTPTATPTITVTPSPSPSPTLTPTLSMFAEIQTTIFNTTCIDSFCHDVQGMSGNLVLVADQSYANLVGIAPQNAAALAAGLLRVEAGVPSNSFLLVKVINPTKPEGGRMPLGKPALSAAQIQLINDWIAAGATQ